MVTPAAIVATNDPAPVRAEPFAEAKFSDFIPFSTCIP
jgi:hypothetical protein